MTSFFRAANCPLRYCTAGLSDLSLLLLLPLLTGPVDKRTSPKRCNSYQNLFQKARIKTKQKREKIPWVDD